MERNGVLAKNEFDKFNAQTTDIVATSEFYRRKDMDSVEQECLLAVQNHLNAIYPGYTLCLLNAFPRKLFDPLTNKLLTDLNGVYILTNDPQVGCLHEELIITDCNNNYKNEPPKIHGHKIMLVIVEIKHFLNVESLDSKIKQLEHIKEYLRQSKYLNVEGLTNTFKTTVEMFRINTFEPQVFLYFGAPLWNEHAFVKLYQILHDKPSLKDSIQIIKPIPGSRFTVVDVASFLYNSAI